MIRRPVLFDDREEVERIVRREVGRFAALLRQEVTKGQATYKAIDKARIRYMEEKK